MSPNIFSFIKTQESSYETEEIRVGDNWLWNMRNHIQLIFHLKNGVFYTGENNWLRAFKQVMRPLLRLSYWTEDIEVKDVVFFIEGQDNRALSFLIKKYHDEVYVREHDLDTLFDEITESDIDYGGVLNQKGVERPETLPLNSVAFCDQTDLIGGPVGFKMFFTPNKIRTMSKFGWGEESNGATISLNELATLALQEKDPVGTQENMKNQTPGKVVEVYVVRGSLPAHYLYEDDDLENHYNQLQVVAFYTKKGGRYNGKEGCILYRKKEEEGNLKFHASEKVYGRALGYSDGEAFLHPQIWSNFVEIHKMGLLEAGSKVPLMTDDPTFHNRNKIQDMENLEVMTVSPDTRLPPQPIQTAFPANYQLFADSVDQWFQHAQLLGSAFDPILGKEQASGTTFRGQERTVAQGRGWHDRRRGQRAKYIESIYRDWIIPDIVSEIRKGKKFLATLTAEELGWVSEQLATKTTNERIKQKILKGSLPTHEEQEKVKALFKENFSKQGNKKLLEVLRGELDGIEVGIGINVAGKQKDLVNLSDKILSIFQFVFANPQGFIQAMQVPALARGFSDILEFSGLNQADFLSLVNPPKEALTPPPASPTTPSPMILNRRPVEA